MFAQRDRYDFKREFLAYHSIIFGFSSLEKIENRGKLKETSNKLVCYEMQIRATQILVNTSAIQALS